MNEHNTDKIYESYRIPGRQKPQENGASKILPQTKINAQISFNDLFYEIEYENSPIAGAGKFVLKSQKIEPPKKDEIRELFYRMREIARRYPLPYSNHSRFYDGRVQQGNARIFYEQAVFMKDFEDDYPDRVQFSSYFPYYQLMGYEQLRTYFTWRTRVRRGITQDTSLSYVFLYIYELLNNIGVDSPQEGLHKLISFWTSYKKFDSSIDKYVLRWLKDYHIYYNLPGTFKEFAKEYNITKHYPRMDEIEDSFDLYCSISKYDISKSVFYTDETKELISDCFGFVIDKIKQDFETVGVSFDDVLFHPTKKLVTWKPFKDALFSPWLKQADRRVVISKNEIYICSNNEWKTSSVITSEHGRQFIGYVIKQMESVLRRVTKYKFKITASIDMVNQETQSKLKKSGLFIENMVQTAVIEFYREATKTVVEVSQASLNRIRQEAFATQEALIVEEQNDAAYPILFPVNQQSNDNNVFIEDPVMGSADTEAYDLEPISESGIWYSLKEALSELELQALGVILQDDNSIYANIKEFADKNNIMLEVLADGINEKTMDYIGDNILDDELSIYEDYIEQVKGMVE